MLWLRHFASLGSFLETKFTFGDALCILWLGTLLKSVIRTATIPTGDGAVIRHEARGVTFCCDTDPISLSDGETVLALGQIENSFSGDFDTPPFHHNRE